MNFGEFLGIIESYIFRLPFRERLTIENDLLIVINSLNNLMISLI